MSYFAFNRTRLIYFGFEQDLDFETVSLLDLDWNLQLFCRIRLGFEKPKSVHPWWLQNKMSLSCLDRGYCSKRI